MLGRYRHPTDIALRSRKRRFATELRRCRSRHQQCDKNQDAAHRNVQNPDHPAIYFAGWKVPGITVSQDTLLLTGSQLCVVPSNAVATTL